MHSQLVFSQHIDAEHFNLYDFEEQSAAEMSLQLLLRPVLRYLIELIVQPRPILGLIRLIVDCNHALGGRYHPLSLVLHFILTQGHEFLKLVGVRIERELEAQVAAAGTLGLLRRPPRNVRKKSEHTSILSLDDG